MSDLAVEKAGGAGTDAGPTIDIERIAKREDGIVSSRGSVSEDVDYNSKEDQRLLRKIDGRFVIFRCSFSCWFPLWLMYVTVLDQGYCPS